MNILVTAGNTLVPIDQVRCITNIFTGRTGTEIALRGYERGHNVTLLTSQPEMVNKALGTLPMPAKRWAVHFYSTFTDLQELMPRLLTARRFEALIHSAAVSDYQAAGIFAPADGSLFHPEDGHWESEKGEPVTLVDRQAAKVKSDEPELWLRLVRTPKLIDQVRTDWGFQGLVVKFKLEVGVSDAKLLEIAERSRQQSKADLMVANTLEGMKSSAFLGPIGGRYESVSRPELAPRVIRALEDLDKERGHG
jgi:phosphopantothenoylcysteine synthetase/decarboxylase